MDALYGCANTVSNTHSDAEKMANEAVKWESLNASICSCTAMETGMARSSLDADFSITLGLNVVMHVHRTSRSRGTG